MGFGGFFNYDRPGPGISKGQPKKKAFFAFFELWARNFWKLVPVSLVYSLMRILIVPTGLAEAGMTNVARNTALDKHSFGVSDFFSTIKKNWKQALPIGFVDVLVCFGSLYYLVDGTVVFGEYASTVKIIWCVLALIYAMVRVYLYPIMVTVELPMGALLKNSLILTVLKPGRALPVILIAGFLCLVCVVADLVVVPLFMYSIVAFSAAFFTQPVIEKYLIRA